MSEKSPPEFTADQQAAIDYRRVDACVVAGPGAGKTTVLVQRYRSLVEDFHFEPRQILAITFTEKAAANMKAKLAELFAHNAPLLRELESAWVSTIHGFCARLLRENAIAAGIDPRFTVLDARESEELQYVCVNAALDELVSLRREDTLALIDALHTPLWLAGDLTRTYDAIRCAGKTIAEAREMANPGADITPAMMADSLRRLVENWTSSLTAVNREHRADLLEWSERIASAADPADAVLTLPCPLKLNKVPRHDRDPLRPFQNALPYLTAWAIDHHTARFRKLIFDAFTRFDELYNQRKLAMGALDFNDLERRAVGLLRERADVRDRVRAQFRQVMLDEFQDINQQQSDLIGLVRAEDVFFAVGDVNQAIYGFRYARTEIFQAYRAAIDASGKQTVSLLHNFRSRDAILRCVGSLLNDKEGVEPRELVAGASFAGKRGPSVEVLKIQAQEDEDAAAKEARWIAHRILALRGTLQLGEDSRTRPADFADFAVLCRNGDSMKPILGAFDHAGIPYVSGRRQSFLLSREGRDLIALLRVIANPQDTIALATVLRSPLAGIDDESLLRLRLLGQSITSGLNRIAFDHTLLADFDAEEAEKLIRFANNLRRWREAQPVMPLDLILVRALDDCAFDWTPGTAAADNIESFLHLARGKSADRTFEDFLREIESLENAFDFESDLADRDQGNVIQVMTAHAAKGLEFPITIIAAMDKGTQRNSAPVTFTPTFGLGVKWRAAGDKGVSDSWHLRNAEEFEEREKHEEHRLLYVAMTRAEEHLILSFSHGKGAARNWAKLIDQIEASDDISVLDTADEPAPIEAATSPPAAAEIPVLPRPAMADQHDSAVNVTSLAVFADCPRKYYLSRYIGWSGRRFASFDPEEDLPPDDETDFSAAELGSAVHEILAGKPGSYPSEAHRLADVFLTSDLGARAAASARAAHEWDFIIDIDGTLIRGSVDLWFEHDGEITLVDYKTDAHVSAEAYTPQLALYVLAIEGVVGKRPAHAYLHFLRSDTVIDVPLDYPIRELLANLREAQGQLRFDLREGDHCRSCQFYRSLCPAGLSAETALPGAETPSQSAAAS